MSITIVTGTLTFAMQMDATVIPLTTGYCVMSNIIGVEKGVASIYLSP